MPESQIYIPYRKGFSVKIRYLNPNWGVLHICSGNNIALQVNIRSHENTLALNSLINGVWGTQEKPTGFPFDVNQEIFLSLGAGADGFYLSAGIIGSVVTFTYKYAYRLPETQGLYQIYTNYANLEDCTILPHDSELIGQSIQSELETSNKLSLTDNLESEPAYLEFSDINSYKFYEVNVDGVEIITRYGRIGTSGQTSRQTYSTPEKARIGACKKLNEKLQKGYVPAIIGNRPPRPPRSLDIAQFIRLAWKPIVTDGDSSLLSSKFSGLPWLAKDEPWPNCPICGRFMQLFFQLNMNELPEPVRFEFGNGLLQMFYCCNWGCEGEVESAVVSYGRTAALNKNLLIRLVQPNGEASTAPIPLTLSDYFPAKTIVDWQQLEDYPDAPDEIVALIYGWEQVNNEEKEDEIVERLGFYDLEDYCEHRLTYEGDKLAGYPLWVQGMEYSGCPICHEPMRQVFQLVSEDNLPYMFGDVGIGHVLQCQTHKEQLAFIWACS